MPIDFWISTALIVSLLFPFVISVYKEVKFVTKANLLAYGVAHIIFTLTYQSLEILPHFDYLKIYSWAFFVLGIVMFFFYWIPDINPINMKTWKSLIFSWKNLGAFEIAFCAPLFFETIPVIFTLTGWNEIFDLGISLFILFWIFAGIFCAYRNFVGKEVNN